MSTSSTQTSTGQPSAQGRRYPAARVNLGWEVERESLREAAPTGVKRPLEGSSEVLPELEHAPTAQRPLWKHPAFLVSMIGAVLAVTATVVFLLLGTESRPSVSDPQLVVSPGNAHLSWHGPDVGYDLFVIGGPSGDVVDASQLVRGGHEAWVPQAAGIIDADACLVVRPSAVTAEVSLDPVALESQGAAAACMADAGK